MLHLSIALEILFSSCQSHSLGLYFMVPYLFLHGSPSSNLFTRYEVVCHTCTGHSVICSHFEAVEKREACAEYLFLHGSPSTQSVHKLRSSLPHLYWILGYLLSF